LLYTVPYDYDIWQLDLQSGVSRNLTRSKSELIMSFSWLPPKGDQIVFTAIPSESELGPWLGYMGVMNADGSNYRILDNVNGLGDLPAPSPDGKFIAYAGGSKPAIVDLQRSMRREIPLSVFADGAVGAGGPTWSPDGETIAWTIGGRIGSDHGWSATALNRLEGNSSQILHPFINQSGGEYMQVNQWSPDGKKLAVFNFGEKPNRAPLLWLLEPQRNAEHLLGAANTTDLHWSPDSQMLIMGIAENNNSKWALARAPDWGQKPLNLPADARIVDWLR
jgi:Tol biopolymer transport system component